MANVSQGSHILTCFAFFDLFQKKDKIQKRVQYSHITREIHTITCLSVARKNINGHKKNWIFNQPKSIY